MRALSFVLVPLIFVGSALDADAGIFRDTSKPKPEERVPELIEILKTSLDEHKRADAADELRQYDAKSFPDIIPALIEALQNDSNPSVCREAAKSIGRMRPYFPKAGYALEMSAQNDSSRLVRLASTTSLNIYYFLGYRSNKSTEPVPIQTQEPPLATPIKTISAPVPANVAPMTPSRSPAIVRPRPVPPLMTRTTQTVEPPHCSRRLHQSFPI